MNFVSFESLIDYILTCFSPFGFQGNEYKKNNPRLPLRGTSTPLCNSLSLCCNHAWEFRNRILPKNARQPLHFLPEHKSRNRKENATRSSVLLWYRSHLLEFSQHFDNFMISLFPLISKSNQQAPDKWYSSTEEIQPRVLKCKSGLRDMIHNQHLNAENCTCLL